MADFKNIIDLHTHTDNSFDGHHSAMFLCESAYMKGLRAIAFTDHIEIDGFYSGNFDTTARQAYFYVANARSAFNGKLIVCNGIELGQAIYDIPVAEALLEKFSYDIVIGSVHNLRGRKDFCDLDYDNEAANYEELLDEYFDELINLVNWGKFDTLAHLTYPVRYIIGEQKKPLDMSRYSDKIDTILKILVEKGKALEINTSGLRQPLGDTMPNISIVKRFRELGGELITVGSDAHYAEHLGAGIEEGMRIAKECGFDCISLFKNREPTLIPIE